MDRPPIGAKEGKVWGVTQPIFAWNDTEAHFIRVDAGYRCSNHMHRHKHNRFFVIAGRLKIVVTQEDGTIDETVLGPNQITDVPPGVYHRFESLENSVAVEFYWVGLDPGDIVRRDAGEKLETSADEKNMQGEIW